MFDGVEYVMEWAINWIPWVQENIEMWDYITWPIKSFAWKIAGVQELVWAWVGDRFLNSTHAVFTIFYNHLKKKYEQSLADLQELQQQVSEENHDQVVQLKQDIVTLQAGMTALLDQQWMEK